MVIATSSLLFFAYTKMASGLLDYVNVVVQTLTQTMITSTRRHGAFIEGDNPVKGVVQDIGKIGKKAASPITGTGKFLKRKFIDQDYEYNESRGRKEKPDYGDNSYKSKRKSAGSAAGGDVIAKKGNNSGNN
ncbi:MAG: hypothetical protein HRU35_06770 [Rickettsiaceae bacterium]|nr:hypothetical protein [Rickettsiaceae bacterium]